MRILPPPREHFPNLPIRVGHEERLVFALCKGPSPSPIGSCVSVSVCAQTRQQSPCEHTLGERSFVGVYCAPELRSALTKGYKLLKVYESWTFARSDDTLLRDMISDFFLVKLKASKLPADEEERRLHISDIMPPTRLS